MSFQAGPPLSAVSLDSKSHILKENCVPILIISLKEQEMHMQIEMEMGSISQEQEWLQGAFYYECSTDASFSSVIQREKYKCGEPSLAQTIKTVRM